MIASSRLFRTHLLLAAALSLNLVTAPLGLANTPERYEAAVGEKVTAMLDGDPKQAVACTVVEAHGVGRMIKVDATGKKFYVLNRWVRPLGETVSVAAKPAEPLNQANGDHVFYEPAIGEKVIAMRNGDPDGRVYHGVPPEGPSNFNWAKEMRENPLKCGTYGINGNKITFSWTGGSSYTWPMRNDARGMEINMSPTNKVEKFGSNAKLSGSYHRGTVFGANYSYGAAPTITKAGIYTFASNGSFSTDSTKGLGGDTNDTGVTVSIYQKGQGTYTINGNDMVLTLGGEVKRCTVYPVTDNGNLQAPVRISINGALFERGK